MKKMINSLIPLFVLLFAHSFFACNKDTEHDLINDPFPEAQAELREVVNAIVQDAETANIEGLQDAHLNSNKFTKFGPRKFDRQDVISTNKSETAFLGSVSDYKLEIKDLKIDVFDDVGIVTYYPHISYTLDGQVKKGSGRQTLVFLKTEKDWKIVHEHGTPR